MKYRHYSPRAEVVLVEGALADILHAMKRMQRRFHQTQRKVGVLAVARAAKRFSGSLFYSLGPGDAAVAARRLFDGLRTLDRQRAEIILCQGFEEKDIGSALMNRLRKAASRRIRV
jgi:L-threonylcarbamoyladenylate synthase